MHDREAQLTTDDGGDTVETLRQGQPERCVLGRSEDGDVRVGGLCQSNRQKL
jgi:hypothetical protein